MEPALVIGKAEKPRCFSRNNIKSQSLPVTYYANTKAWMTSSLSERCLLAFDRKLKKKNKKFSSSLTMCLPIQRLALTFTTNSPGDNPSYEVEVRKRQLQFMIALMDKDTTLSGPEV